MGILSKIVSIPLVAKTVLKIYKNRAFKPFQSPLDRALEKQEKSYQNKIKKMVLTNIGKKLGIKKNINVKDIPVTDYSFYESFFNNPQPQDFMFPLENYVKIRTSGTSGKHKVYLRPKQKIISSFMETGVPAFFSAFHNGDKITLEYGDNFYVNMGPAPFAGGSTFSIISKEKKIPFFNILPNVNLPYEHKVNYFISNHQKIDGAIMLASTLITQVMPAIGKPIQLKGLLMPDTPQVGTNLKEILEFTGVTPRTAYASTETIACSIPSIQHTLGFVFDLRRGLFEFCPLDNSKKEPDYLSLDQVKVGEKYRLIFTDLESDITRFDTKDAIKCIANGDDFLETDYPVFKFLARAEKSISLHTFTRIDEGEVITVLREAKIDFQDFTARLENDNGHQYLAIYLEPKNPQNKNEIQKRVHEQFIKTDEDYKNLSKFFEYEPLRIYLLPKGSFSKYLAQKEGSMAKIDRINMREEEFSKFLKAIE